MFLCMIMYYFFKRTSKTVINIQNYKTMKQQKLKEKNVLLHWLLMWNQNFVHRTLCWTRKLKLEEISREHVKKNLHSSISYSRVILVPLKKCLFQLPVFAVYEFSQGTFMDFLKPFSFWSLLVSKIYKCLNIFE